ncbi:Metal tolerance protein 4 [Erysiphe necator]|uniref:Putative cation diffusion facilitator 1 n=1 Tax=Uncinula necator TaxID=52586 RepID=A0A0B1P7G0_UNCNE|nr:Metal tolerance protein 4 [Erysiphe necator]KHJ32851.1 putative cation diffusion facilitator 1 [Erysiphe necator]
MSIDIEKNRHVTNTCQSDPYQLRKRYKSERYLNDICSRETWRLLHNFPLSRNFNTRRRKQVRNFYTKQNERIEWMLKSVNDSSIEARVEGVAEQRKVQIAIYASLFASILLAALQIFAAITSNSLCLFTSMASAIFDPLSNLALIICNLATKKVNLKRFPAGKSRLETLGNISFCFIMISVSLFLIILAIRELMNETTNGDMEFKLPSLIAVIAALIIKLHLLFYCWGLKDKYSQVNILWQDHRSDLFINGFAILMNLLGSKFMWWIDPTGTIIISIIVSFIWLRTMFGEFLLLIGISASFDIHQLVTYICVIHSPSIKGIETVRVYHSGPKLIAEIDILMGPDRSLRQTHDVAEGLKTKLEKLPDIERAYVHVNYEIAHKLEHSNVF